MSGSQKGRQEEPAAGSRFGRARRDADLEVFSPATSRYTRLGHCCDQSRDRASPASRNYATTIQRPPIAPAKTQPAAPKPSCTVEFDRADAFHGRDQRYTCGPEGGEDAKQGHGENGNRSGESKNTAIEREIEKHRHVPERVDIVNGDTANQKKGAPARKKKSDDRAHQRDQHAFRKVLLY